MTLFFKKDLRKSIKVLLSKIPKSEFCDNSKALSRNIDLFLSKYYFLKFSIVKEKFCIGGFAPLKSEANWQLCLTSFSESFAFPGINNKDGQMSFFRASFSELIETCDFGVPVMVPPDSSSIVIPDILLIPGLAFSVKGERLGRGKGFYDKYLAQFEGVKVGICFEEQICSKIPVEEHDQNLDYIITNSRVIDCRSSRELEL